MAASIPSGKRVFTPKATTTVPNPASRSWVPMRVIRPRPPAPSVPAGETTPSSRSSLSQPSRTEDRVSAFRFLDRGYVTIVTDLHTITTLDLDTRHAPTDLPWTRIMRHSVPDWDDNSLHDRLFRTVMLREVQSVCDQAVQNHPLTNMSFRIPPRYMFHDLTLARVWRSEVSLSLRSANSPLHAAVCPIDFFESASLTSSVTWDDVDRRRRTFQGNTKAESQSHVAE